MELPWTPVGTERFTTFGLTLAFVAAAAVAAVYFLATFHIPTDAIPESAVLGGSSS